MCCKVCGQPTRNATCGEACHEAWFYRDATCATCGKLFKKKRHDKRASAAKVDYCGHKCYLATGKVRRECEQCGCMFTVKASRLKQTPAKFCTKTCEITYRRLAAKAKSDVIAEMKATKEWQSWERWRSKVYGQAEGLKASRGNVNEWKQRCRTAVSALRQRVYKQRRGSWAAKCESAAKNTRRRWWGANGNGD